MANVQEKFNKYADLLRKWNGYMNLVAPSTLDNIQTRHIDDSAQLAGHLSAHAKIVDLGSGAGFPGVVLAILGRQVVCIESIAKKAGFLQVLKDTLDLPNLTVFNGRVESWCHCDKRKANDPQNDQAGCEQKHSLSDYKIVGQTHNDAIIFTARAFAPLIKILDLVPRGSRLLLLKGRSVAAEIAEAQKRHKFDYALYPSKTGDGFILWVRGR